MSFNPGGGGISSANDVALSAPADNEALGYDSGTGKWRNKNASSMAAKEQVNVVASSGSALTLAAPTASTINYVTLTANCTITMPTASAGLSFTVVFLQDGTGSRTVTWPAGVKWPGGTAPTLTTTAGAIDCITFLCPNTAWHGFLAGNDIK